jgi:hypothetical protein
LQQQAFALPALGIKPIFLLPSAFYGFDAPVSDFTGGIARNWIKFGTSDIYAIFDQCTICHWGEVA